MYANGDIESAAKAARVLEETGAAGVMIGRAAQGRPWLCGQVAHYLEHGELQAAPDRQRQQAILHKHLLELHDFYGEYSGVRVARKHVSWYLQSHSGAPEFRRSFNAIETAAEQLHAIENFFIHIYDQELAA